MRGAARAPASVGIEVAGVIARRILAPAWRSTQCEDQADDYYRKTIVSHDVAPSKAESPFDFENGSHYSPESPAPSGVETIFIRSVPNGMRSVPALPKLLTRR